jgi:hypothetical protein
MKKSVALLLVGTGAIAIAWPFLPQEWGLWELMGWLFDASDDPSMGIQYMFFWMATFLYGLFAVPIGSAMLAKQSPQPALTAAEREAISEVVDCLTETGTALANPTTTRNTLAALLERLA